MLTLRFFVRFQALLPDTSVKMGGFKFYQASTGEMFGEARSMYNE